MLNSYQGIVNSVKTLSNSLPFITGDFTNLTLSIAQGTGDIIIDPITGNFIPAETSFITFKAKVVSKKDPYLEVNLTQNTIRTYLEGWLVSPLFFDGTVPKTVSATLKQNNVIENGKFTFIDKIPTSLVESFDLQSAIGQRFCGYFQKPETNL